MGDTRRYDFKDKDTVGMIYLLKNEKVIREKKFKSRWERRKFMKEFYDTCKIGQGDSYFIDIKLDI